MSTVESVTKQIVAVEDPTIEVVSVEEESNPLVAEYNAPVALLVEEKQIAVAEVYTTMQGPPGPPGQDGEDSDAYYVHNQQIPSATWVIQHDLGKHPAVTVVDSGGSVIITDVVYDSLNQLTVLATAPFGGKAYLN